MSAAYIDGQWACYSLDGRRRHYLGCRHERPRQAIAHTAPIYTSPLRVSGEATTPVPVPPSGAGSLVASSEPQGSRSTVAVLPAVIPPSTT